MARVRRPVGEPAQLPLIAESTPAGVVRQRRRSTLPDSRVAAVAKEVEAMAEADRWEGANAVHLVVLYLKLHLEVYGVEASDCGPADRLAAIGVATNMLGRDFDGDAALMAEFVWWTWEREKGAEKWRRENHRPGRRVTWQLQFSQRLLTDYRVHLARR